MKAVRMYILSDVLIIYVHLIGIVPFTFAFFNLISFVWVTCNRIRVIET